MTNIDNQIKKYNILCTIFWIVTGALIIASAEQTVAKQLLGFGALISVIILMALATKLSYFKQLKEAQK